MIRHVVLVRFAPATPNHDIDSVFGALDRLREVVPGMGVFAAGPNASPEGLGRGFTHAFAIDFDSAEARDAYLVHPDHKAAGGRLVGLAEGGIDGILVFDLAIDGGHTGAGTGVAPGH